MSDLHAAIMNLPIDQNKMCDWSDIDAYMQGFKDARHAAAELVSAALSAPAVPQWPMRGARVDGDTVVISVKGGNDAARWLCGELVSLIDAAPSAKEPT